MLKRGSMELCFLMAQLAKLFQLDVAEREGFEPSVELLNPTTV